MGGDIQEIQIWMSNGGRGDNYIREFSRNAKAKSELVFVHACFNIFTTLITAKRAE